MGFWGDIFFRRNRRREAYEDAAVQAAANGGQAEPPKKRAKILSILTYVAIIGLFVDVALVVLGLFRVIPFSTNLFEAIGIIGVICLSSLLIIPWIRYIANKEHKILSIVFLCFVGVCTILWIVSIVLMVGIFKEGDKMSDKTTADMLNTIKASLLITIQFCVASSITSNILKFGKKWIVFQIIMYVSLIYIDFYFTSLILCMKISAGGFKFVTSLTYVGDKWAYVLLSIAFMYSVIASAIMNRSKYGFRRRRGLFANTTIAEDIDEEDRKMIADMAGTKQAEPDAKKRLAELKEMLDQGLITQEEYDAKRKDIIEKL